MFDVMLLKARKKDTTVSYLEGSDGVIFSGVFNSFVTSAEFRFR